MQANNKEGGDLSKVTREFKIINKFGIHARPAAMFAQLASSFDSDIFIEKGGTRVSAKSIMGLMTLEASFGVKLKITAEGPDAEEAVKQLTKMVESKFDED